MKTSPITLVAISGLIWFAVGFWLLFLGLRLLVDSVEGGMLVENLAPYTGGLQQAALLLVALGLWIGYYKGKFALGKSVKRNVDRLQALSGPVSIVYVYSRASYILLLAMMCLGMLIKFLGIPNDIRGVIDVAVGSALLQGAVLYFRHAWHMRRAMTVV